MSECLRVCAARGGLGLGLADARVALAASVNSRTSVLRSRAGESPNALGKLAGREQKRAAHTGRRQEAVPSCCWDGVLSNREKL